MDLFFIRSSASVGIPNGSSPAFPVITFHVRVTGLSDCPTIFDIYLSICICVCSYILRSEDTLQESLLSFHHMGPGDWTQIIRLGSRTLPTYPSLPGICSSLCIVVPRTWIIVRNFNETKTKNQKTKHTNPNMKGSPKRKREGSFLRPSLIPRSDRPHLFLSSK